MQRVWVGVLSVWALLAIVAVLAWTHRPLANASPQPARAVVVQTANGKRQVVLLAPATGAAHATTHTSGVPR
jgi:cyanate permease